MNLPVGEIHLIFKTHLDIGFTDYSQNVTQIYMDSFIPQALSTSETLRKRGGSERFIWTTGSWLINEFLEQADSKSKKRMETAIKAGDIVWHGLPFTSHSELMDVPLFEAALKISKGLDQRYGRETIAAKMTDVPGHTRGIIAPMSRAGVKFLHIGVNPACTPPSVPTYFRWHDPVSDESIIVMYQKGSYGDLQIISEAGVGLAFAHTSDNLGPQTPEQVLEAYAELRAQFPEAKIFASTLDDFTRKILPYMDQFPVVNQEIGDTWIHGVGTDPLKVSQFRELMRLRHGWDDPQYAHQVDAFTRRLMMVAEHTWGMDEKTHLRDYSEYSPAQLKAALKTEKFKRFAKSWDEQRVYITDAVTALEATPYHQQAVTHLQALNAKRPSTRGYKSVSFDSVIEFEDGKIHFNASGAVDELKWRGKKWASADHTLGHFRYEQFSAKEFDRFYARYNIQKRANRAWVIDDYTKPGIENVIDAHRWIDMQVQSIWKREQNGNITFLLQLAPLIKDGLSGCPAESWVKYELSSHDKTIHIELQWFDKVENRLPEALWFSFNPIVAEPKQWMMHKMGQWVSPLDVISNGNRKLHGVDHGVGYFGADGGIDIQSWDAALVAPGAPSLLNFSQRQPNLNGGFHFNLYNNIWGTNFPMWYGDNARFRFDVALKEISSAP